MCASLLKQNVLVPMILPEKFPGHSNKINLVYSNPSVRKFEVLENEKEKRRRKYYIHGHIFPNAKQSERYRHNALLKELFGNTGFPIRHDNVYKLLIIDRYPASRFKYIAPTDFVGLQRRHTRGRKSMERW
ncbi:hypothetical protein OROHE_015597 [Orobanche hederae]